MLRTSPAAASLTGARAGATGADLAMGRMQGKGAVEPETPLGTDSLVPMKLQIFQNPA